MPLLAALNDIPETVIVKSLFSIVFTKAIPELSTPKIPTKRVVAKKRYFKKKADDLMNAVNSQLMSQNNSRMPISNNSKSTVIKGRQPNFQE